MKNSLISTKAIISLNPYNGHNYNSYSYNNDTIDPEVFVNRQYIVPIANKQINS